MSKRLRKFADNLNRFCQEGPNKGKPGPCPGGDSAAKPAKAVAKDDWRKRLSRSVDGEEAIPRIPKDRRAEYAALEKEKLQAGLEVLRSPENKAFRAAQEKGNKLRETFRSKGYSPQAMMAHPVWKKHKAETDSLLQKLNASEPHQRERVAGLRQMAIRYDPKEAYKWAVSNYGKEWADQNRL